MEPHLEASVGLFTTDIELNIQIWDSALERMTGIKAQDAIGQTLVEVISDLRDRPTVLARFRQALEHGTIEVLAPAFHRFLIRCDPAFPSKHFAEMRQQTRIAPLRNEDVVCGLAVTIEDVTRRMENEIDLAEALKDPDPSVRLEAARAISAADDPLVSENSSPVIAALDDPDWKVRRNLVAGMARRAADDAIAALLRAMRDKHLNFSVVNGALQILRASSVDTSATLVEYLSSEETDLRMHAALALGEQRDPNVIPDLIAAVDDEDVNVRYHAIEALGKLRAAEALDLLMSIAENRDFFLSFAALDAVAEIGDSSVAERIVPLLQDEIFREAAIRAIGQVGRTNDIAPIVNLLDGDEKQTLAIAKASVSLYQRHQHDPVSADDVMRVAKESISDSGLSHLADALRTAERGSLASLIPFAGWFPDESISERLCALIDDEDLRETVVAGLLVQGETAIGPLITCLDNEDVEIRRYAARSLGKLGAAGAVLPLISFLENGTVEDALAAIDALGSIDSSESVKVLLEALEDPESKIREAAVRALGRQGSFDFAGPIILKSKDENEFVRHAAIEQIPGVAGHSGLAAIVEALETDTPRVRAAAARAVAQIDHTDALEPLRNALNDSDAWTRYFAVRGIGARRDIASADKLKQMIDADLAEQVRMAAKEVSSELGI